MTLSLSIIQDLRSSFLIFTPKNSNISETVEFTSIASYLNPLFIRDKSNNIITKLYEKHDAFGFHIVNGEVENSEFSENSENQFSEVFNSEFSVLYYTQNRKVGVENLGHLL